jgi:PhzF family phenazine biosynthesis protein
VRLRRALSKKRNEVLPDPTEMQSIASAVGFSETAFVAPTTGFDRIIRYYSPTTEIPFCGHATIATGAMLGRSTGDGTYQLATTVGMSYLQTYGDDDT